MSSPDNGFTTDPDPETNPGLAVRIANGYVESPPPRYQPPAPPASQGQVDGQVCKDSAAPDPITVDSARAALRAAGLWPLVAQFAELYDGRFCIQIKASASDAQVAAIYRAAGLGFAHADTSPHPRYSSRRTGSLSRETRSR